MLAGLSEQEAEELGELLSPVAERASCEQGSDGGEGGGGARPALEEEPESLGLAGTTIQVPATSKLPIQLVVSPRLIRNFHTIAVAVGGDNDGQFAAKLKAKSAASHSGSKLAQQVRDRKASGAATTSGQDLI